MAFQLVGIYDGVQEAKAPRSTVHRSTGKSDVVHTVGSLAASLPGTSPEAGFKLLLCALGGLVLGLVVGRKWK